MHNCDLSADIYLNSLRIPARLTQMAADGCELDCPKLIPPREDVALRIYLNGGGSMDVEGTLIREDGKKPGMVSAVFELRAPNPEWEALSRARAS